MKIRFIKQEFEKECGAASLGMILSYYGVNCTLSELRQATKVDDYGCSIYGISQAAKKYGFNTEAYQCDDIQDLLKEINQNQIHLPVIIRILNNERYEHYVVLDSVVNDKIKIYDPGHGKVKYKKDELNKIFLGEVIQFIPCNVVCTQTKQNNHTNRIIKETLKKKTLSLMLIFVFSVFIVGIGILSSLFVQYLTDLMVKDESFIGLITIISILIVSYILSFFLEILRTRLLLNVKTKINENLSQELVKKFYNLKVSFISSKKPTELQTIIFGCASIANAITEIMMTGVLDIPLLIIISIFIYIRSRMIFIVTLCSVIINLVILMIYMFPVKKIVNKVYEDDVIHSSNIKEMVDGYESLKVNNAFDYYDRKIKKSHFKLINSLNKETRLQVKQDALIELCSQISYIIILLVGAYQISLNQLSIGMLVGISSIVHYFYPPLKQIFGLHNTIESLMVTNRRLENIFNEKDEIKGKEEIDNLYTITLNNAVFQYGYRDHYVLNRANLSLNLKDEKIITIVGQSGVGKSTLLKILAGIEELDEGKYEINLTPINEISKSSLIGYLPQKPYIFNQTIREYLSMGLAEMPSDAKINGYLRLCNCDFISELPAGIDTVLFDNGLPLSGGQQKRLALAKVLIRNPKLLILDEPFSSLDPHNKNLLKKLIIKLSKNKVVILSSHESDRIKNSTVYRLKKGNINKVFTNSVE